MFCVVLFRLLFCSHTLEVVSGKKCCRVAKELRKLVVACQHLQSLTLNACNIGDADVSWLVDWLPGLLSRSVFALNERAVWLLPCMPVSKTCIVTLCVSVRACVLDGCLVFPLQLHFIAAHGARIQKLMLFSCNNLTPDAFTVVRTSRNGCCCAAPLVEFVGRADPRMFDGCGWYWPLFSIHTTQQQPAPSGGGGGDAASASAAPSSSSAATGAAAAAAAAGGSARPAVSGSCRGGFSQLTSVKITDCQGLGGASEVPTMINIIRRRCRRKKLWVSFCGEGTKSEVAAFVAQNKCKEYWIKTEKHLNGPGR